MLAGISRFHMLKILLLFSLGFGFGLAPITSSWGDETSEALLVQQESVLKVAAVQFEIYESSTSSIDSFKARIREIVERCIAYEPDLIVFPEYTCAFIALIPYYQAVQQSEDILEGFKRIREVEPLVHNLKDLFLLNSRLVERVILDIFRSLSRKHSVYILGGTYFAWKKTSLGEIQLRNRAFFFDRDGRMFYTQDKVYLTDFETSVLRLSPGTLREAEVIKINNCLVGLTICRDTFFSVWEDILSDADLWIDIKANGAVYNQEERKRFSRALPARIKNNRVSFGGTVCLTGRYLDLFWEGESSLIQKKKGEIRYVKRANSPRDEEILFFTLKARN